jgi:replication termination factor 2
LKLTHNPAPTVDTADTERQARFACPLTLKEMTGTHPFVYLSTCGCVFSQAGLRAVSSASSSTPPAEDEVLEQKDVCPQCASKFTRSTDIVLLNPGPEEQLQMREAMDARRAAQATLKPKKAKKRKLDVSRPATPQSAPFTNNATATSRTVANALAQEELKRKHGMSDAVRSLYTSKNGVQKKETFMTRGTFTRVRHPPLCFDQ